MCSGTNAPQPRDQRRATGAARSHSRARCRRRWRATEPPAATPRRARSRRAARFASRCTSRRDQRAARSGLPQPLTRTSPLDTLAGGAQPGELGNRAIRLVEIAQHGIDDRRGHLRGHREMRDLDVRAQPPLRIERRALAPATPRGDRSCAAATTSGARSRRRSGTARATATRGRPIAVEVEIAYERLVALIVSRPTISNVGMHRNVIVLITPHSPMPMPAAWNQSGSSPSGVSSTTRPVPSMTRSLAMASWIDHFTVPPEDPVDT